MGKREGKSCTCMHTRERERERERDLEKNEKKISILFLIVCEKGVWSLNSVTPKRKSCASHVILFLSNLTVKVTKKNLVKYENKFCKIMCKS